jgi:L-ectoine synthase
MPIQIVRKAQLTGTDRHVRTAAYETHRFLLAGDGAEVTVTDVVLRPGIEATYGYDRHVEVAYCLEGAATLTDLETGATHAIAPGTLWVAPRGSRFRFVAAEPTRLVCVFTPPFAGRETGFAGDQEEGRRDPVPGARPVPCARADAAE